MPLTIRATLVASLAAGLLAGLVFFMVQLVTTEPLIAQAEVFEQAELQHGAHVHAGGSTGAAHQHEWEPEAGIERTAYTLAADGLIGIGYAFLLVGAISLRGGRVTPVSGLGWGLAGFAVFVLGPSLGLPPEPPGGHPADLLLRQEWWLLTAAATAAGLGLMLLQRRRVLQLAGLALLVVPHVIGAPEALQGVEAHGELGTRFVWASLAANAALWASLGLGIGFLLPRLAAGGSGVPARA